MLPPKRHGILFQQVKNGLGAFFGGNDVFRHRQAGGGQFIPQLGGLGYIQVVAMQPLGLAEDLFGGALHHNASAAHDQYAVGLGGFLHIVGNGHNGNACIPQVADGFHYLGAAAVMYTFYLYFSFSGYSEISRATGLVLGLDLPENFKTPFYATNFSGFWSRWHISFSSWLQDYLFMPLAWADLGRFGRLPTELCVFCVFFASGFWHGSTAPFIIWGLLQAVYRVGEELLHRRFGKPKKRGTPARVLWGKRVVVFVLWTISMVFFRVGSGNLSGMAENLGVGDAFVYLGRCLMNSWSPARFAGELYSTAYTGFYANTIMVAAYWAFAALALALGIWLDHRRNFACKNKPAEVALASAKHRNALYVVLIVFILVGYIMQSGGFNANAFGPYAGF